MPKHILVTSPHFAFSELLRTSLEETGKYTVHLAKTAAEALACAGTQPCEVAILDADLEDSPQAVLGKALLEKMPGLRVVAIPSENDARRQAGEFSPHATLSHPFYLPELLETLEHLLKNSPAAPTLPGWLRKPRLASAALDDLLNDSPLLAAMLFTGKGKPLAYSAGLNEEEAVRLAELLHPHWNSPQAKELALYVRREEGREALLYAVRLVDELVLAALSENDVSLSQARARTLALRERITRMAMGSAGSEEPQPDPETDPLERLEDEWLASDDAGPVVNLSELLAEMPPPDPQSMLISPSEWLHSSDSVAKPVNGAAVFPWENAELAAPAVEAPPASPPIEVLTEEPPVEAPAMQVDELVLPWEQSALEPGSTIEHRVNAPADIRSQSGSGEHMATLQVFFTCLLIPRMVRQTLTGPLAEQLSVWMPQHCQAFGWSLHELVIQPEYLQWTVSVTPVVTQGTLVRIIRQRTSVSIYDRFPELKGTNTSGDFWAPGHLIVSGKQPPTPELLRDFITQTRRRQGIYHF